MIFSDQFFKDFYYYYYYYFEKQSNFLHNRMRFCDCIQQSSRLCYVFMSGVGRSSNNPREIESLLDKVYDQTTWIAKASSLVFCKLCECAFGDCPSSSKNEPKIQSYS